MAITRKAGAGTADAGTADASDGAAEGTHEPSIDPADASADSDNVESPVDASDTKAAAVASKDKTGNAV